MKTMRHFRAAIFLVSALAWMGHAADGAAPRAISNTAEFQTSDRCVACHNGMVDSKGDDYSIGSDWATSLMANSSRDPYWQASVRRETMDHGPMTAAIEDECSACHMPIPHYKSKQAGQLTQVLANLPSDPHSDKEHADGVSCSVCHQITREKLGTDASFNGNFVVGGSGANGTRAEYGPYEVNAGLQQVMRSSTAGFEPQHGPQIQTPELCASCHTLITEARDAQGNVVGAFPEQMIYQEWQHSDYRTQRTCQSCHMPPVEEDIAVTRILGSPRPDAKRHQFVGANFAMQKILARYRDELNVSAEPREMYGAADRTMRYLQNEAAALSVAPPLIRDGRLEEVITVENLGGHKLPTAYPSRRVWLHVLVRDRDHRPVFESGALNPDGSIVGNDNDIDPSKYEAHYREIRQPDQVQIYESILGDVKDQVTTGLLFAARYLKDNRILPRGFDKSTAAPEIAVRGDALADPSFTDGRHSIKYSVELGQAAGPFQVDVELWYQPIGYRWANNLKPYDAEETRRFTAYYQATGAGGAVLLVKASRSAP
ncbi:MAG: NapC/NirT family cytochrome c [Pseudomonadota bacterium]|nr:NapC/NirT family cytochrome c [Pseudomonadota bacterium]